MTKGRWILVLVGGVAGIVLLAVGGAVWAGFQLADQLWAPGIPPATGSGACSSADAVDLQLVYADGRAVQACTHDRPSCQAAATVEVNGQKQPNPVKFNLDNRLRSSSGEFILTIQTDVAVAPGVSDQVFQLGGWAPLPKGDFAPVEAPAVGHASVTIVSRYPSEAGFVAGSGTVTVSSIQGTVTGVIDGTFPASGSPSPVSIRGGFACRS